MILHVQMCGRLTIYVEPVSGYIKVVFPRSDIRASIFDVDDLANRMIKDFQRIRYPMLGGNVVPTIKISCSWLHVFNDHLIPIVTGGSMVRVSRAGWIDAIVHAFKKHDQFVHVFELTDHKIFVDLNKKFV